MKVGRPVWFCKKLDTPSSSGEEYAAPQKIITRFMYFTVMGKKGASDIIEFGDTSSSELTCIAQPYELWEKHLIMAHYFIVMVLNLMIMKNIMDKMQIML